MDEIAFDDLLKSLSASIKEAQHSINLHQLDLFEKQFEKKDGDSLHPKMLSIPIPQPDGTYTKKEVPITALIHHNSLHLQEVKIKMAVTSSVDTETNKLMLNVKPNPTENVEKPEEKELPVHYIELTFKEGDTSEGISRVNNEIVKRI